MLTLNLIMSQIELGMVCEDRAKHLLSHRDSARTQEVSQVHFWGQRIPILSSSFWPSFTPMHIHQVQGSGSFATLGNLCTTLRRRMANIRSVCGVGGPHEEVGAEIELQDECTFSSPDKSSVGFDHNTGMCRIDM